MAERLRLLEERRRHYDQLIARAFAQDARCQRLGQIEGIGPMTATALVAAVGDGSGFATGRHGWAGSAPVSGPTVLLSISKRAIGISALCWSKEHVRRRRRRHASKTRAAAG